jgi:hypothetical protein
VASLAGSYVHFSEAQSHIAITSTVPRPAGCVSRPLADYNHSTLLLFLTRSYLLTSLIPFHINFTARSTILVPISARLYVVRSVRVVRFSSCYIFFNFTYTSQTPQKNSHCYKIPSLCKYGSLQSLNFDTMLIFVQTQQTTNNTNKISLLIISTTRLSMKHWWKH